MRAWIVAVALLALAAPALAQDLPAPTPEDIGVRVTAAQDGTSVEVSVGEALAVELQSAPSTGSSWRVASRPDFLGEAEQLSGPVTAQAPGARPLLGAPRWQVFVFPVSAAGEGEVVIEKRGPGVNGAVLQTLHFTITAH